MLGCPPAAQPAWPHPAYLSACLLLWLQAAMGLPYGAAIDLWSVGVVLAEVALKRALLPCATPRDLLHQVRRRGWRPGGWQQAVPWRGWWRQMSRVGARMPRRRSRALLGAAQMPRVAPDTHRSCSCRLTAPAPAPPLPCVLQMVTLLGPLPEHMVRGSAAAQEMGLAALGGHAARQAARAPQTTLTRELEQRVAAAGVPELALPGPRRACQLRDELAAVDAGCADLVMRLLAYDPAQRLTAHQVGLASRQAAGCSLLLARCGAQGFRHCSPALHAIPPVLSWSGLGSVPCCCLPAEVLDACSCLPACLNL